MSENKLVDLSVVDIKKILPNRYPFLLIDGATEIFPGVSAKGYKNVTVNENFFQGHFPDSPLMPGMIQMEALLQTLSLAILTIEGNSGKSVRGRAAKKIRLKERVMPGTRLDIETEVIDWNGTEGIGKATGIINGKDVCGAEFEFELVD